MNENLKEINCSRCGKLFIKKHRSTWCSPCHVAYAKEWAVRNRTKRRDSHRRQRYGIEPLQYRAKVDKQFNLCMICGKPPRKDKELAIDHDHSCCPGEKSCGKCIRDLLCDSCNLGLGAFKDDLRLLENAVKYLKKYCNILAIGGV